MGVGVTTYGKENPFNTKYGHDIVSIEENFWARLSRLGRMRNRYFSNAAVAVNTNPTTITVSIGCLFYPRYAIISSTVDAILGIVVGTGIPDMSDAGDGVLGWYKHVPAGGFFEMYFNGSIWCVGDTTLGGGAYFNVSVIPTTAGYVSGGLDGIEVAA